MGIQQVSRGIMAVSLPPNSSHLQPVHCNGHFLWTFYLDTFSIHFFWTFLSSSFILDPTQLFLEHLEKIKIVLSVNFCRFGIGATIRIGQKVQCLPYAGFSNIFSILDFF